MQHLKIFIFCLLLFGTQLGFAAEDYLLDGNSLAVDVANQDAIGVKFKVTRLAGQPDTVPVITVVEEEGGFECSLKGLAVSETAQTAHMIVHTYRAVFDWKPGADVSGCTITVADPSFPIAKTIKLYMFYR